MENISNKIDIFLFDLDGTITEPKEGITKCVQYSLKAFGIDEPDLSKLECFIGPPLHKSYQDFYGFNEEDSFKLVAKYRERYSNIGIFECEIFEGIEEVFKAIKSAGGKIALATSKPEEFAIKLLEHYNISQYFDCVTGSFMDGRRTEKVEVIEEVFVRMKITDADKKRIIMIGDRKHDIIGANKAGILSIGVKYGYGIGNELEENGATYIVDTTMELCEKCKSLM